MTRLAPERIRLTASFAAQAFHMRWFQQHLPTRGVAVRNVSTEQLGFQIAGPRARTLLACVCRADVSNAGLPFLRAIEAEVGLVPATICRVTYTGDLGYEIYVHRDHQIALYEALREAGAALDLRPFGMRAMMSLRLEKSFGAWLREYMPDYTPAETGLDRFVAFQKSDFIGRDAAAAERATPPPRRLVTLVVDAADADAVAADAVADEPVWQGDEVVGFVTSGGYAHSVQQSVALALVPRATHGDAPLAVEILGERRRACIIAEPLFDPQGARMRG